MTPEEKARACYQKLVPHGPPDLPIEKSTTMQAYLAGHRSRDAEVEELVRALEDIAARALDHRKVNTSVGHIARECLRKWKQNQNKGEK